MYNGIPELEETLNSMYVNDGIPNIEGTLKDDFNLNEFEAFGSMKEENPYGDSFEEYKALEADYTTNYSDASDFEGDINV